MKLAITSDRGARRQNRRFHWRSITVGKDSIQRYVNDISEIQLNFVVSQGVEEAIERLSVLRMIFRFIGFGLLVV